MKLDQKYFVPFMGISAVITMIFIVFASFDFKAEQVENFKQNTRSYEQLLTETHPLINEPDSLRLGELNGSKTIVLFWASWSEKSEQIMNELDVFASSDEFEVVGALVKDATETAEIILPRHDFKYIDGTKLFNQLKVPGIPSYFLLDEYGEVQFAQVGYKENAVSLINDAFSK